MAKNLFSKTESYINYLALIVAIILIAISAFFVVGGFNSQEFINFLSSINRKTITGNFSKSFFLFSSITAVILFAFSRIVSDKKYQIIMFNFARNVVLLIISTFVLIILSPKVLNFVLNNNFGLIFTAIYAIYLAIILTRSCLLFIFNFIRRVVG